MIKEVHAYLCLVIALILLPKTVHTLISVLDTKVLAPDWGMHILICMPQSGVSTFNLVSSTEIKTLVYNIIHN